VYVEDDIGQTGIVAEEWQDGGQHVVVQIDHGPRRSCSPAQCFELINEQEGTTTMSDITDPNSALRAKLQNVDEVTKTLRKYNMEDTGGERTSAGFTALQDRLWAENREAIAKDLQELEAEANAPASAPDKA
jgi:putative N-acetylmannosamine-6-phosphate epimerase